MTKNPYVRTVPPYLRTVPVMGTLVTIQVVGHGPEAPQRAERISEKQEHDPQRVPDWEEPDCEEAVDRAFAWFHRIEACCTRFDPRSELMQLTARIGVPVPVSSILFEALQFALAVAEQSGGAFDPTVGHGMETRGFNREYLSGRVVRSALEPAASVSYRDVRLDPDSRTVLLLRPLLLDLGGVAKGLAIDMAARELAAFGNFAIDAGGDLYLGGCNRDGAPWSVGIRHPRGDSELIDSLRVSGCAVCTSGDYERRSASEVDGHHILDPRTGSSAHAAVSATVVAPTAMLADALATAAFVLGPADGIRLLERLGVDGLIISPALERFTTRGMRSDDSPGSAAILSDAQGAAHHRSGDSGRPGRAV